MAQNTDPRSRLRNAGRKLDQKLSQAERRIQRELDEVITCLDQEVVPNIRDHSSRSLRSIAEKLNHVAEYMDKNTPKKS